MSEQRSLLVGFDLCDDITQISCFNTKTSEIDAICKNKEQNASSIPTVLTLKNGTNEWFFGKEAMDCAKLEQGTRIDHIVSRIISRDKFIIDNTEISAITILEKYFRKTLSLLKQYYPNDSIKQLVITVEELNRDMIQTIYQALDKLGIQKDRAMVQSHEQSYFYYALSQKKEFWLNDVGLFELNKNGLFYYQIMINRKASPMIVQMDKKDFTETFPYELLEEQMNDNLGYIFENIAKGVLFKQIVSTLYITGNGFEGDWSDEAIKELCIGRRVFKGQNLYTHGACYAAREIAGQGELEEFVFLSEDMLKTSVCLKVYYNAKMSDVYLLKAGTPWYDASESLDVILDQEDELQFLLINPVKREERSYLFTLDGLMERPNRTIRLTIEAKMMDKKTVVLTVKDKGFGTLFPSSNRIWEKSIVL